METAVGSQESAGALHRVGVIAAAAQLPFPGNRNQALRPAQAACCVDGTPTNLQVGVQTVCLGPSSLVVVVGPAWAHCVPGAGMMRTTSYFKGGVILQCVLAAHTRWGGCQLGPQGNEANNILTLSAMIVSIASRVYGSATGCTSDTATSIISAAMFNMLLGATHVWN